MAEVAIDSAVGIAGVAVVVLFVVVAVTVVNP